MKRYPKYKDSGVKWIGEIPEHWESRMLKRIAQVKTGTTPSTSREDYFSPDTCLWYTPSDFSDSTIYLKDSSRKVSPTAIKEEACKLFPKNTVFLIGIGGTVGKVGLSEDVASCNQQVNAIISKSIEGSFLAYYLMGIKQHIVLIASAATLPIINQSKTGQLMVAVPPIEEQQAIVAYLDEKVGKIDRYISEKEKEIVALDELKQATIANAVTRGLDPNAPLKDSGIKWIGNIPQHWEVSKIRRLFKLSKEKTETSDGTLLSLSQYTGVRLKSECEKTGMFEAESTVGYNVVHKGQFVMNIMLAWNGSYAVSNYDGIISPAYCVFDFQMDCIKQYFDYLLRQKSYAGAFKTMSKGLIDSRLRLYPDYFKTFPIIIPPIKEQQAIVDYINTKTAKIDQMKDGIKSEIEKLKEYKQRLISDVVTGKVCVKGEK